MKIDRLATAAWIVTGVLVSVAEGGAPMGPATAFLGEGRWAIGGEYAYEQTDLEAFGTVTERFLNDTSFFWTQPVRIDDLTSNMFFGTLAFGICDNWDIFARLGAADAKDRIVALTADADAVERQDDFDGSFGLAWGAGTRATFCRFGPWSFGGLMQVTWFRPGSSDFSIVDPLIPDESWVGDMKLNYWQAQASLAATYQADKWRFWAGPFLQFTRGDMNFNGAAVLDGAGVSTIRWASDLQESTQVGGHFGANWEVSDVFDVWVEGQITGDSWLVGVGALLRPEKSFGI
jgi:hypothetical protein